ncbi:MAG: alpha/beta hydrolase [Ruminococcaceae bacterium]|nr:alpha/beta hydrolase [Oscillospiraceae bacterium]
MITETIYLKPENEKVTLEVHSFENETKDNAPAMLIMPGGAYWFLSDREKAPIAERYAKDGFKCFVLNYTIMPDGYFPEPLKEASLAVIHIKENAAKYGVDADRIFLCGFSAGGHLACALGTMWHTEEAKPYNDMKEGANKPFGMILAYPWVSLVRPYNHEECTVAVCQGEATEEKRRAFSPYLHVSERTVPAYIWTTADDTTVPVQNSLLLAHAMADCGIPFELHVFPKGDHGLALADYTDEKGSLLHPDVMTWTEESVKWCNSL